MRKDIEFKSADGVTLRGWHYLPETRSGKVPTIIMAHGLRRRAYVAGFAHGSELAARWFTQHLNPSYPVPVPLSQDLSLRTGL